MKAWKIRSKEAWNCDCLIIFEEEKHIAWQKYTEQYRTRKLKILDYDFEEWNVTPGAIITPQGYDSTDASLES